MEGAQGRGGARLEAGRAGVLQGDFWASPLQDRSISLLRMQLPPLPHPPAPPGSQERSPNLHLACTAPRARPSQAQPSCHLPPVSLLVSQNPFLCPPLPFPSPTAISKPFCLGMGSALLHVLQSHSQIHNWWSGSRKTRALLSPPSLRDAPAHAGEAVQEGQGPGSGPAHVPGRQQESSAGWRCLSAPAPGDPGWEKALQAGSDHKVSSWSRPSPFSRSPTSLPRDPRVLHGACRNLGPPALQWRQEIEDSSDEFFKFVLMDYVACTFDVLDVRPGEEALDLWVVFGAAGQGNTPREAWSEAHPGAFPRPPQAEADPRSDHVPFPAGRAWGCPQIAPRSPTRWCHRLLEAESSLQDLPCLGVFLPPWTAAEEHKGSNHRCPNASLQSHLI